MAAIEIGGDRTILLFPLFISLALVGCSPNPPNPASAVLLFNGAGTSPNDVAAFEQILEDNHLKYSTVNSGQLNGMSVSNLMAFRLLIIPGGNYITMGRNLSPGTSSHIQGAVRGGLNYLGICAGGLLAGAGPYNHLNLTEGVPFGFYSAVNHGIHKTVVAISTVGSPMMEHYWEDGPQFAGWGATVGRYPDGTPAVVEGTLGRGWIVLCGFHPEAPELWRRGMNFNTSATADNAYAWTLINAAFNRTALARLEKCPSINLPGHLC